MCPQTDLTGVTMENRWGKMLEFTYLALPTASANNELSIVMT